MENKPICEIDYDGTKRWYLNGVYHREDGPAMEFADGRKQWCLNGKLHRLDGPAIENHDGHKQWWVNSKCHRLDGPAIEFADGGSVWYFHGIRDSRVITQWAEENEIDLDNLTEVDKALIKLTWADYGK